MRVCTALLFGAAPSVVKAYCKQTASIQRNSFHATLGIDASCEETMSQQYWLMKSEPDVYSIEHLESAGTDIWDGIRNYQARNFIRTMKVDDVAFFYHSNCAEPGIYGEMKVSSQPYPDPTALDKKSKYFFAKATKENNPWTSVDVDFVQKFEAPLLLSRLKDMPLGDCPLTAKGNRLSVMPITPKQYQLISSALNDLNSSGGPSKSDAKGAADTADTADAVKASENGSTRKRGRKTAGGDEGQSSEASGKREVKKTKTKK